MSLFSSDHAYIQVGLAYLKEFNEISDEIISRQLNEWEFKSSQIETIDGVFRAFLMHAQNRQGMPNTIGGPDRYRNEFCNFCLSEFNNKYKSWEDLFNCIRQGGNTPGRMDITNNRSHWVIYCKSAVSIAEFLEAYNSINDFHEFTNTFFLNEHTKLALPLLISAEIFGFGFALACDFIKENLSPDFVKPDVHINDIAFGLGISQSKNDFDVFKDMIKFCRKINQKPCEVDKLFWLIGSGDFYLSKIKINSSKNEFIRRCLSGTSD